MAWTPRLACVLSLVAVFAVSCREEHSTPPKNGASPAGTPELAETNEDDGFEEPPYSVRLKRLGATDGAAWTAHVEGGRILMWLGPNHGGESDAFVAVLRSGERPHVFVVYELDVSPRGKFIVGLTEVGRDVDGEVYVLGPSPGTYLYGSSLKNGVKIRINDKGGDEFGVFPSALELRRDSEEDEKATLQAIQESIK